MLIKELLLALLPGVIVLFALSIKWALPFSKSTLIIFVSSLLTALVTSLIVNDTISLPIQYAAIVFGQCLVYVLIILCLFYRDPERKSPNSPDLILSPADGKVIYIRQVNPGAAPVSEKANKLMMLEELRESSLNNRKLWQIGISMVFTDVHVNRSPIAGKVTMLKHKPGRFLSLRNEDTVGINERQTMMIENEHIQVGIVQIASRLVRRIEAYVWQGMSVVAGQRIGIIKFGSQVDLFVPVESVSSLDIRERQNITAGITVISLIRK
jgi:phosphatidylserine decarboxylase